MDKTVEDNTESGTKSRIFLEFAYSFLFLFFYALFHFIFILLFMTIVTHSYLTLLTDLKQVDDQISLDVELMDSKTTVLHPPTGRCHSIDFGLKTEQLLMSRSSRALRLSSASQRASKREIKGTSGGGKEKTQGGRHRKN